jgi:hypothetical protein
VFICKQHLTVMFYVAILGWYNVRERRGGDRGQRYRQLMEGFDPEHY